MAKRGATEQITKDTWERDEDDGGRDRSEEPAEVASQAVLAKRKILKPKSRVGGISAAAPGPSPSPASSGLFNFGPPAATNSTPTTSLFGQLAQTTPSKNLFGQPVPLSSTPAGNPFSASKSENSLFPNLFGTPMPSEVALTTLETAVAKPATAVSTPQVASSIFGAPAPQLASTHPVTTAVTATPPTFVFGAPSSQITKPGPSIFAPSTLAQGPTGAIAEPQKNLFGFPAHKPQEVVEAVPSSTTTTPTVTPAKPPLFGSFGDSAAVKPSDGSEPRSKILFGAPPHLPILNSNLEEGGENEKTSIFNTGNGSLASNSMQPSSRSLFPDLKVANPQSASAHATGLFKTPTMMGPSGAKDIPEDVAKSKQPKHDPKSLIPPPGVGVTQQDMPTFNWLYQVKSLNLEIQDRIQEALSKDPFTNLTGFINYYQDNLTYIDSVKLSQEGQLDEKAETEADNHIEGNYETKDKHDLVTPSKASKLFESALAPSASKNSSASLQNETNSTSDARPFSGSVFQSKPSTGLFNQPTSAMSALNPPSESIFSGATTKSIGLFGSGSSSNNDTKTAPLFQFGSQSKAPVNIFDSAPSKESDNAAPKAFAPNSLWNSKPNSAAASNASSPGSVLAGGTAGMKDSDTGGWSNPFTQENPLFLPGGEDDDDEDGDEGEKEGENNVRESNEPEDDAPESSAITKPEPTSVFGAQQSSSNSLFGRVSSTPTFNFGQIAAPKTGAVGLIGNTAGTSDKQTWTPDKGIKFGDRIDSKGSSTASGSVPAQSLFGLQSQAPAPGGLFGNTTTKFNFPQPTNGKGVFSNSPLKSAIPSVLLSGLTGGGLAPPATTFGGPSPAPSDISTPGEASNKEGGEDDNDPSDEAGQQGGNTKDLSGKGPGEEEEDEVFETRSSIYNLNNGAYVKIGIGRLRVLKNRINGRARIVVKVETGKVLMNVGLRKELDYTKVSESEAKGKVVKIIEFLPEGKSRVWVMKVGTAELAQKLRKTLEEKK
ncbi:hypothetical protein AOL_s00193g19 [Orbilia oligospora ATCC 24927]|uniref:RanBD1 domain-containing protein n=1 Tax=Arthrobotrys oligospora (strain ATCC 24927 / CBS 115.81 / DSM 1491) TaxID=756982 RepID=G1XR20_ARTOA|nr:hypothetical protein AOL_s00193g19 [Orbilia oligospora ATCC 24927]EGX44291.1 hypothetical protein AOL_s00193g19 [Orbilia oligospora ATCC 24927]